jgi:hypothetical protein
MKITFVLGDMYGYRLDTMYTGKAPALTKRSVTIELTEEQVKQINIRQVGTDCGKPQYEDVFDVFIENEVKEGEVKCPDHIVT